MEYEQLARSYRYGLSKIYELVINNDPCYAYLLDSNQMVDQKLVMAHVYGHCDFFKNNQWFASTNRKMMDEMANHGNRVRMIMDRVSESEVEEFIDVCLSIDDLIDVYSSFTPSKSVTPMGDDEQLAQEDVLRFDTKEYLEAFINPREVMRAESQRKHRERQQQQSHFPEQPQKDVLLFLLKFAPLKPWEREVLSIIRDEAYYFAPQGQTKIMNEGWASYWHSTMMTQNIASHAEIVDFADHHSGTVHMPPGSFNPYKIGLELFRHIEYRWNHGQFGKEYDDCDDYVTKKHWDRPTNLGRKKIFEVRRVHNDVTFIDEFLTEDFCRENRLFTYAYNRGANQYEIESRQFQEIKERLLFQLSNHGRPYIYVQDGNFLNRGELYLQHKYLGVELQGNYARDVMTNLHRIWSRPVHLETIVDDRPVRLTFDGSNHHVEPINSPKEEKQ